jgi:hypothetical protein
VSLLTDKYIILGHYTIDFEKERTGHCEEKKLSLLVDHIMNKYIIVT